MVISDEHLKVIAKTYPGFRTFKWLLGAPSGSNKLGSFLAFTEASRRLQLFNGLRNQLETHDDSFLGHEHILESINTFHEVRLSIISGFTVIFVSGVCVCVLGGGHKKLFRNVNHA